MASPQAALRRGMRLAEQGQMKRAFPLLARAATAGIAEAEFRVGRCYLEGVGVPASRAQGARWLERAGDQGYVEAQALLATLYLHGLAADGGALPSRRRRPVCSRPTPPCSPISPPPRNGRAAPPRRVRRRPGVARLHPHLRTREPAQPRRSATLVRAIGRGRLPAGPSRLCAGAGARRHQPRNPRRESPSTCGGPREAGLPTALYLLGMITERGLGVPADPAAAAAVLSARRREGPSRAARRAGAWRCWRAAASRAIRPRANPGCGAPRWPAIRRPRRWSATSMPRAASCRRITPRRRSGSAAPPRPTTAAPRARWACCI